MRRCRTALTSLSRIAASSLAISVSCAISSAASRIERTDIVLDIPAPADSAGGIILADVNDDGRIDFLVTVPGHLAVYDHAGRKLWILQTDIGVGGQSESEGLPGHHGPGVAAGDVDGDGRDEILGATVFSPEGKLLVQAAPFEGHMDSVFVADVSPERPGLEVVLLEEGSNHVQLLGLGGVIWRSHLRRQEPQNAVVGRFRAESEAYFIWCRSRYNEHQRPFVFDATGKIVFEYEMDRVAPKDWTPSGVEVIHAIDWTGARQQLACAKERHRSGDVCLFEPLSGRFVERFSTKADRLYVADVKGDWREEILVLEGNVLAIFQNTNSNPRPNQPSPWSHSNYRRLKHAHNYYSP